MRHLDGALASSHHPGLVALSIIIAICASYVALDLAGRTAAARRGQRTWWLIGGAISMGLDIFFHALHRYARVSAAGALPPPS